MVSCISPMRKGAPSGAGCSFVPLRLDLLVERVRTFVTCCFTTGWRTRCPIAPTGPGTHVRDPAHVRPVAVGSSWNEVVIS